MDRFYQKYFDM